MSISDWINVVLCILSFVLAAVSVVTVIITIRQNNRMIQNSTRPYIVLTIATTFFQDLYTYIVIKNYGSSGATIKALSFDIDISKYTAAIGASKPFSHVENTFLAPSQKILTMIKPKKLYDDDIKSFSAHIEYTDGETVYNENYNINIASFADAIQARASTKDKEIRSISYAMQDLVEKLI